jgi:hypothetical protein
MTLAYLLALPVVKGALAGALAAAVVDFQAFRAWQSWHDIVDYRWSTASFRWLQGAIVGAVTALGLTPTL